MDTKTLKNNFTVPDNSEFVKLLGADSFFPYFIHIMYPFHLSKFKLF